MCEFCVKHGEGKKWYLNAKSYSDDLLNDLRRQKFVKNHLVWIEQNSKRYADPVRRLSAALPVSRPVLRNIVQRLFKHKHWSQVVPIEDVERIFEFVNSVTRIPCICRKITKGTEVRTCFLISVNPGKLSIANIIDSSFFGGPDIARFEKVDKKWALEFMREKESHGMVHTIWSISAPFVGAICNCDYATGCMAMRMIKASVPFTFRSEYVAVVDNDKCVGCGECLKVCQFNAISIGKRTKKAVVNIKKCYGCGICRSVCKQACIVLEERQSISAVSQLW